MYAIYSLRHAPENPDDGPAGSILVVCGVDGVRYEPNAYPAAVSNAAQGGTSAADPVKESKALAK